MGKQAEDEERGMEGNDSETEDDRKIKYASDSLKDLNNTDHMEDM